MRTLLRTLGALLVCFTASTAFASAGITVNKAFAPNSVALGALSTVTVTLQNDSTSSAATITAFSDDIGTTMAGHASLLSSPAPTTTCPGGTPTIAGQVLSMNNGQIPIAPSVSAPGSCTITFSVAGAVSGNGFNTIAAANVVTSLGAPGADVTQTLNVQTANLTATASSTGTAQIGDTSSVTFVLTNPAAVALTGVAFPITSSAGLAYTVSNYTTNCGGTATLPASGTTGTTSFSGLTIPASGACTVTLSVTSGNSTTATFALGANAVTDAQGATDASGATTTAPFTSGRPTVTKSFSPTAVVAGGSTTLTFNVQNSLATKPLTNAAESDTLPTGLVIGSTPTANANCGSPTLGGLGTGTLAFSGGTIAANRTCTITATVSVPAGQAAGSVTNSVPAANFTSTEAASASGVATANLLVTGTGGGMTISQSVTPTTGVTVNAPVKITLNFISVGTALSAGTFTDVLPQTAATMVAVTSGGAYAPTFSGCGSSPAVAFGGMGNGTTVSGSNLATTSGGTCTVAFYVAFNAAVGTTKVDTNTLLASNVSFTGSSGAVSPPANATANLSEVPTFSINNYVTSNSGLAGQPLTVAATLYDSSGTADTSAVMVVNLTASHVALAMAPNFTFTGCPAGFGDSNIAISGTRESFIATLGSINATCSIGYDVIDEGGASGTWVPANSTYSSTLTGGVAVASTALNSVTFATSTISITKAFSPNQIQSGGNSTADITLKVPQAGTIARTQANGVAFSDALPANVTFSPTPNVTFTGCQQTGQPAPAFAISGTTISITNVSLLTLGAVPTACDVTFDVTSSVVGAPLNQINASAVTSASGITNTQNALASLTVDSGLGIAKTFLNPSFQIGSTDYVRFLVTNSASSAALSGGTIVDAMPASLALASTTLGAIQAGDPPLCGGSVAGPVGRGTLTLSGLAVAGLTSPTAPGQCVVYVQVKASASALPGSVNNTIAAGGLNVGGYINQVAATGSVTLIAAANATLSKTFAPALIQPGATSVLSIVIDNTASGAAALSGMALTDTLPTGLRIAATPNASTTCGFGTLTAVAASTSVALVNGGVAGGGTCTITLGVTGTTSGTFTNTIAANALTTTQGATNVAAATANLAIASITLSKAFAPATIAAGGTSLLTITIPNGATPLTAMALTDTLPAGVTIAAVPNAATTCPSGSAAATAGGSTIALTAGTLAASATCTLSVNVTATTAASYTNTIAANALSTAQTVTNATAATANLAVGLAGITLTKTFGPATIVAGGASTLTITIPNTAPGAVALSGMALTDTLPAGVTIAATPNAATTCPAGTVSAVAGGTSVTLATGTLAGNASCTMTVSVTGTAVASYTNTILPSALTTTQGVSNAAAATAPLTISPASITLSKAFAPATIVAGGTSMLTITIPNTATGAVALTGMALTDTLPSGITIAATPNAGTTCPGGSVTAAAAGASVTLIGGTLAANATCTIVVQVTGTTLGSHVNTITTHALNTAQTVSNQAPASATIDITAVPDVTLIKAFSPTTVSQGATSLLTISLSNTATSSVPLTGLAFSDAYPTGLVNAATPAAATTCPAGSVTAVAGTGSLVLSGGTLAANASCTVTVNVDARAGTYANTVSSLTTTQGATNVAAATANLSVTAASAPTIANAFTPPTIVTSGFSALTITIANTGTNAIALGNLAFADTLPAGITIAPIPNAATTCPAGAAAGSAGGSTFSLSGAALAAGATCTLTIDVTGTSIGSHTNTIAANALSDTQALTNAAPASAVLTVTGSSPVTIVDSFSPTAMASGQSSLLTVAIANTGSSAIALSGVSLMDALPAGMTLSATPAGATTCASGSVTAAAGATSVSLLGARLAAGAECSITVNVTSATLGAATNTIPVSAFENTQGVPSGGPASATLTVTAAAAVTLTQTFAPASIVAGTVSVLTFTLTNAAAGAVALSGVALGDALPAGVVLAAIPNASTTCPSGTLAANARAATFALSSATLGAGATCTITVSVTAPAAGDFTNTIAAGTLTSSQGATNVATTTTTLVVTAVAVAPPLTLTKAFAPASIVSGGVSTLTLTVANAASGAIALTSLSLSDTLPPGAVIAATPDAATTCGSGTVTSAAGSGTIALANGSLAAGAGCTISVIVTSNALGAHLDTSEVGAVSDTQNVSNAVAASATLSVTAAPALGITQAFLPAAIAAGGTSVLKLTLANTAVGAIPLTALAFTDTLPAGVVLATTPGASTTCPAGTVTAVAGAATFALSAATLGANATCTIVITVTAISAGTYANSVAATAVSDAQAVTNVATQAMLTVAANAALRLTKTSDVAGAAVDSGQTIGYTVTIVNAGSTLVTGARLSDVLTNATLVPNSVTVAGAAAPDAVVKAGAPFGSITPGATVAIRYRVTVDAGIQNGAQVTNTATAGSDQGCAGTACSGTAPADAVLSAPKVNVALLIDGKVSATVILGQVVLYSATLTNVGGVSAQNVMLTDTLPVGVTPILGSVTVTNGAGTSASATSRTRLLASAVATTAVGQSVTASLGTIAAGASATVTFRATITAPIVKVAANTVTVAATGIPTAVTSNVVVARMVAATLTVTKSASAVVARIGDRVDYAVRIAAPAGIPFGQTTIVDQLPDYLSFAPGSARINGVASVPTVAGHMLTWTLPSLGVPITLTYATAIAAGVSASATLNNLVTVSAAPLGGGPAGGGSASAVIQIAASTFGTCYPITGRVYDDRKNSGRFESGDTGLAGVSIVLDDGESVVTDAHGRYNFPCVRQGMHALRLDEKTLPDGSVPFADRAIDSERSIHRLVHGIFDDTILQDVNFAITRTP